VFGAPSGAIGREYLGRAGAADQAGQTPDRRRPPLRRQAIERAVGQLQELRAVGAEAEDGEGGERRASGQPGSGGDPALSVR
jgi:hypothetical protein